MRLAIFDPDSGGIRSVLEFWQGNISDALLNIPEGCLATEVGPEVEPGTHYINVQNDDTPTVCVPEPLPEVMDDLRARRDGLLFACDWTQLPDAPLTEAQRAQWRTYRQALREVPETGHWPEPPLLTE